MKGCDAFQSFPKTPRWIYLLSARFMHRGCFSGRKPQAPNIEQPKAPPYQQDDLQMKQV
jgi:hypothetical protein